MARCRQRAFRRVPFGVNRTRGKEKETRKVLVLFGLMLVVALLVACAAPTSGPATTVATQTKVVEPTRNIEKAVTTLPESQPMPTPTPEPAAETFIFAASGEPICLDPAISTDDNSVRVTNQIFEGLVKFDGDTTNVLPSLAEKWVTSGNGRVWTFTLRQGVKFQDQTNFNADAIVKNWDYWRNTRNSLHAARVKGGQTFEYYEAQFGGLDGDSIITTVEAIDPTTVKFTLRESQGSFLNNLAMSAFTFWSPTALEKAGVNSCKTPVGTGSYKFVEWNANEQVTLEAFTDYWDKSNAARMKRVIIRNIPNNSSRLLALASGEIHGMDGLEPTDLTAIKSDNRFKLIFRPANSTGYVAFNFKVKEFQDLRVRQAFAIAINKVAIVDQFYGGAGLVAKEFQPPALWGYNKDIEDWKYDSTIAKKLLADAGFPNGISEVTFDGKKVPLDFWYLPVPRPYYSNPKEIAAAIAADWAKAGINVRLQTTDWTTYLDKRKNGQLPLYMLGWTGDNGDPDNFVCYSLCLDAKEAPLAREGFVADKEISDILKKAAGLTDQSERSKHYQQAEKLIHDRALRIFIANNQTPLAFLANVDGYVPNPLGIEYLDTVIIK